MSSSAKSLSKSKPENFLSFCFVFDSNEEDIKDFQVSRSDMNKNMSLAVLDIPFKKNRASI